MENEELLAIVTIAAASHFDNRDFTKPRNYFSFIANG